MCRKCHGKGRYYTQEIPGVYKIHPCNQCMQNGQAQEQEFKTFLERLNRQYEQFYGKSAPSFTQYHNARS